MENVIMVRCIYLLIKCVFNVEVEILVCKKMKFKKNNIYICCIKMKVKEIFDELGILKDGIFMYEIDYLMI